MESKYSEDELYRRIGRYIMEDESDLDYAPEKAVVLPKPEEEHNKAEEKQKGRRYEDPKQ
jgi:hypothetical protein